MRITICMDDGLDSAETIIIDDDECEECEELSSMDESKLETLSELCSRYGTLVGMEAYFRREYMRCAK